MGIFLAMILNHFMLLSNVLKKVTHPLDTNLVVADASRTEKTICLAVSLL